MPVELLGLILDAGHFDVAKRIHMIWGFPECGSYLDRLLICDRVERQGFKSEVFSALSDLRELHRGLFEHDTDIWKYEPRVSKPVPTLEHF